MSFTDLVMAICLAVAVVILGAAMVWAFMDAHRDSVHRDKHPSPRRPRPKSRSHSLKSRGG